MTDETIKTTTEESSTVAEKATVAVNPELTALKEQIASLTAERDSMRNHSQKLLDETKQAKAQKAAAEEAKLFKDKDFEQLLKSRTEAHDKTLGELKEYKGRVSEEKINNEAMKIASSLADGFNAEILSESLVKRLRYTEDGIKVLDKPHGDLTVSSVEELKKEFQNSDRYKSLLRGNKSSGGGAVGGGNSVGTDKERTSAEIDKMTPLEKKVFFVDNGGVRKD